MIATPEIVVNERDRLSWRADLTVAAVLAQMKYTFPNVIVSINGKVVPHDAYTETTIPPGADVRVIHLMAGG